MLFDLVDAQDMSKVPGFDRSASKLFDEKDTYVLAQRDFQWLSFLWERANIRSDSQVSC